MSDGREVSAVGRGAGSHRRAAESAGSAASVAGAAGVGVYGDAVRLPELRRDRGVESAPRARLDARARPDASDPAVCGDAAQRVSPARPAASGGGARCVGGERAAGDPGRGAEPPGGRPRWQDAAGDAEAGRARGALAECREPAGRPDARAGGRGREDEGDSRGANLTRGPRAPRPRVHHGRLAHPAGCCRHDCRRRGGLRDGGQRQSPATARRHRPRL